jgi:Asp-tRNA(Asn)/Glu-tRNA(Gln) amidotransferase A subunit family amidase
MDLGFTPALELAELIEARELSPVDLTERLLAEIDRLNPSLRAFLTVLHESALGEARAAERRALDGTRLSPMDGVPYTIKDLEVTAGIRTTMGSKWYEDFVPDHDTAVAGRLRASGGVLLGKTNTPAFGYKIKGDNQLGPPCVNPWDTSRTAGGSSSGAAAGVAAGLGPLAHGSDGAGSIRVPASLCGVVGLKPSFARVPDYPSLFYWSAFSHNGPITRTVRDAALMLQMMAGPDRRDPLSLDAVPDDYVAACDGGVDGLRVVVSPDLGYAPVDPEVRELFERAAGAFEELGCVVERRDPGWTDPAPWFKRFYAVVHAAHHAERARERPDWTEPSMLALIEEGEGLSAVQHDRDNMARSEFYDEARLFFEDYDLMLTPTMPTVAWPAANEPAEYPQEVDGVPTPHTLDHVPFMFPFNITGQPAISVPCGFNSEGLPVGLQITGRWHEDSVVLRAAAAFEAARPWADRRPGVAVAS